MAARVLCIANQKGGVGKTTTAINLSAALAISGGRTLLVDLDPQCNATTGLGAVPAPRHPFSATHPAEHLLRDVTVPGLDVLPGSRSFDDTEALARGDAQFFGRLNDFFREDTDAYSYILIDCPPSLGQLTETALGCSTEVLMPIQCEYFAMEGLTQMIEVIRRVMRRADNQLEFGGIVLTMYDDSLELTLEVDSEVRDFLEISSTTRWCRATSRCPRHPVMANLFCTTRPGRAVLAHTSNSAWRY